MKKRVIASIATGLAILTLATPADAQRRGMGMRGQDGAAMRGDGELGEFTRMPPVALPAGTQVDRDLAYGADPAQRLDVYRPPNARNAPIILMVHGGGWWRGDKAMPPVVGNKVAHWIPKGYIVVSANYRMVPAANPRQQADDVAKALAFVQAQAGKWGGNPDRLVLMGHSAGAHLVALLGAQRSIATSAGAKPWLGTIALDSAAYDVVSVMSEKHFALYDRAFGTDRALWKSASPALNIEGRPAPMLLVCSSRRAASCAMADEFSTRLHAAGSKAEVIRQDMSHGEINARLGTEGPYTDQVDSFLATLGLK